MLLLISLSCGVERERGEQDKRRGKEDGFFVKAEGRTMGHRTLSRNLALLSLRSNVTSYLWFNV